jgi:hypothetical protein
VNIDQLDRWLYLTGTSEPQFAMLSGVSRGAIRAWRCGGSISELNRVAVNRALIRRNGQLMEALSLGYLGEYAHQYADVAHGG